MPRLFLIFFTALTLSAQFTPPSGVTSVKSDPSGSCTAGTNMQFNVVNGKLWGCNGTWAQIGGSSMTWPTTPGVTACTGTPCTAWGPSLTASTTVNGTACALGSSCTIALSAINPQTSTYQVLAGDFSNYKTITVASGTFTITLVASGSQPAAGQYIGIINYGSGAVTIARSGQNINGGTTSIVLPAASATAPSSAKIWSDGTNYFASTASPVNTIYSGGASPNGGTFSPTNMTGASAPTPYVVTSSLGAFSGNNWMLFCGGCGTYITASAAPGSVTIDLGSGNSAVMGSYSIKAGLGYDPRDWTMAGSNDGSSFTTLDTQSSQTFSGTTPRTFTLGAVPSAYRYFRFNCTSATGGGSWGASQLTYTAAGFTGGNTGDFYLQTSNINPLYGPRPSGGSPTWPALLPTSGAVTYTASGCSNSAIVGSSIAGSYHSGTTGTCTVTVTMGGSATAPNGWACRASDLTTTSDTVVQTATTQTTATLSGTTVSGDVISFSCVPY